MEECGNDMDAAIKRLHELCLGSAEETSASAEQTADAVANGMISFVHFLVLYFVLLFRLVI